MASAAEAGSTKPTIAVHGYGIPRIFSTPLFRPIVDPCNSINVPSPCTGEAKMASDARFGT